MAFPETFAELVNEGQVVDSGEMARTERLYEEILLETSPNRVAAQIASIYAEALLAAASKRQQEQQIGEELDALVHGLFDAKPELEMFFANPAVHRKHKIAAVDKALAGQCSPLLADFLKLLCKHERMAHIRLIAVSYRALRDREAKRVRILVESAAKIDDDQLEKLRALLAGALREHPILINRVRPDLLGGILLHVGDDVYDLTVRGRLETLRTQFLARGSHEIQTRRDRFRTN